MEVIFMSKFIKGVETMKKIVVALGGNAILKQGEKASYDNQNNSVKQASVFLTELVKSGYQLVVSHGNGPQVGNLVLQNEIASSEIPEMPIYILTAETQGFIGYMLEENLNNRFLEENIDKDIVTILSRVEVSKDDEAFNNPVKPIGRFYSEEEYNSILRDEKFPIKQDSNRGYRRVVFSPKPVEVLNAKVIKNLMENGSVVIATGGGGIPVIVEKGRYRGIDAVIDKDLTSYKLAESIDADIFMILTDVENVFLNYGQENEEKLGEVTVSEMEKYIEDGHFSKGSMLPKVEAALEFAKLGKISYICSLNKAKEALDGSSGTKIVL